MFIRAGGLGLIETIIWKQCGPTNPLTIFQNCFHGEFGKYLPGSWKIFRPDCVLAKYVAPAPLCHSGQAHNTSRSI